MEELMRKNKMLVVADEAGNILAALWPGYKLRVPPRIQVLTYRQIKLLMRWKYRPRFHESAPPDLTHYYLQMMGGPTLRRKPAAVKDNLRRQSFGWTTICLEVRTPTIKREMR